MINHCGRGYIGRGGDARRDAKDVKLENEARAYLLGAGVPVINRLIWRQSNLMTVVFEGYIKGICIDARNHKIFRADIDEISSL